MSIKQLSVLGVATLALFAPIANAKKVDWSGDCIGGVINLSYTYGGDTIYYNNHCNEDLTIYYADENGDWGSAFDVTAHTKDSDSVWGEVTDVDASGIS